MHTVKLKINDDIYNHIMFFLKSLDNNKIKILEEKKQKTVSKELKDKPWHVEGTDNAEWVLMDYVNIVVHVFQKHIREYYNIESLWGDAKITTIENKY